jgi:hypothetical protein
MAARREFCPEGRPCYRWTDPPLKHGDFDTRSGLDRRRLQLAEGQEAVGSVWSVRTWVPVYAVAAAVPKPALSPAREARYQLVRTCSRCKDRNQDPWPVCWPTGRRTCMTCMPILRETEQRRLANIARRAAVAHATMLLADPQLAIAVEIRGDVVEPWYTLVAVDGAGDELATVRVARKYARDDEVDPAGAVRLSAIAGAIDELSSRRLVAWWHDLVLVSTWQEEAGRPGPALVAERATYASGRLVDHGGDLAQLARSWLGRNDHRPLQLEDVAAFTDAERLAVGGPHHVARARLLVLQRIAADRHPDGKPWCPVVPLRHQRCYGDVTDAGVCERHLDQVPALAPAGGS